MKLEEQVLSIEQAKHLQSLGLDMSDAAFTWHTNLYTKDTHLGTGYLGRKRSVYTYTLQEVLDELPDVVYVEFNKGACILRHEYIDGMYSLYYDSEDGEMYGLVNDSSFLKAAYDMLCWVVENGYLKEDNK